MDQFSEIRPYLDQEVEGVLEKLIGNPEVLRALMRLRYPKYLSRIPFIKSLVKYRLKSQSKSIKTVDEYQGVFKILMDGMILLFLSLLFLLFATSQKKIEKSEGAILVLIYAVYLGFKIINL